MVFPKEEMHEIDNTKFQKMEEALKRKDQEMNNILRHLEERNHHERLYKQELHMKGQQIINFEKERFGLINENKQLRIDRTNFIEQLKELQESVKTLKRKNLSDEKLMMDAYVQTGVKKVNLGTQSDFK